MRRAGNILSVPEHRCFGPSVVRVFMSAPSMWCGEVGDLLRRGNAAFSRRDFQEATVLYEDAIAEAGKGLFTLTVGDQKVLAILHGNLSGAYLMLDNAASALSHADNALQIWPEYAKAFGRRGAALHALNKTTEAAEAYRLGLNKYPKHQGLLAGFDVVLTALAQENPVSLEGQLPSNKRDESGAKSATDDVDAAVSEFVDDVLEDENVVKDKERAVDDSVIRTAKEEIERLTQKNYEWFNLNPFLTLRLPTFATPEDIKQRYRRISSLIHPDKCRDPRARLAFEEVDRGYHELIDAQKRANTVSLINMVRERVLREQRASGTTKVNSDDVEKLIEAETMKMFAVNEQKRRDADVKKQSYRKRAGDQKEEEQNKLRASRDVEREWRKGMDDRVGQWRNFKEQGGGTGKRKR